MGLFGKKKEPEAKTELPPLKFPELPPERKETQQSEQPETQDINATEERIIKEAVAPEQPAEPESEPMPEPRYVAEEEKPLFVKIEKYREVMATLNELKGKLKNATDILAELDKIKEDEEKELSSWHEDLESIKEKLMSIDKALFEL